MKTVKEILPENLKAIRAQLGISQNEMADLLDVSMTGYQKFEYGDRFPRPGQLDLMARRLKMSVGALLSERRDTPVQLVVHVEEDSYTAIQALTSEELSTLFARIPVGILRLLSKLPKATSLEGIQALLEGMLNGKAKSNGSGKPKSKKSS